MKSDIFVEWLHHLDNWFRIMDQKILLLINNARSHFNPKMFNKDSSDLSEDEKEETVAEFSHSAQNRTKSKKKATKKPNIKFTNIKLIYLPPNMTVHLQLMDAGIIHSFKSKYKQEFCKHLIQQFDNGIDRKK
jgi:hypothetical protein